MENFNPNVLNFIHLFDSTLKEIPLTFDDEVLEDACLRAIQVRYSGTSEDDDEYYEEIKQGKEFMKYLNKKFDLDMPVDWDNDYFYNRDICDWEDIGWMYLID